MANPPLYTDVRDRCAATTEARNRAVWSELDQTTRASITNLSEVRQRAVIDHLAAYWINRGPLTIAPLFTTGTLTLDDTYETFASFCRSTGHLAHHP